MKRLWAILGGVASALAVAGVVWQASNINSQRIQTDKDQTEVIQEVVSIVKENSRKIDSVSVKQIELGEDFEELKQIEYGTRSVLLKRIESDNSVTKEELKDYMEWFYGLKKNEIVLRSSASGTD